MIPKIIHFCWFGRSEYDSLINKCMESWHLHCPEYKIIKWDEDNFDVEHNLFVSQAYKNKKFAFVSDYVRLYALKNFGGIYLDTDVEIIGNINSFLSNKAFTGFEDNDKLTTSIIGCEKGHSWIIKILEYYNDREFILNDGSFDMKPNTEIITEITNKYFKYNGLYDSNTTLSYDDLLKVYPWHYFSPKSHVDGIIRKSNETVTIHHFNGSWLTPKQKYKKFILNGVTKLIGINNYKKIRNYMK
ncbi:glycosyltransferase family 32 protein [Providencia alcalifaciens]|uniref:glycosyltransferase family 32 protein n=1 Tax=Providencia alcalifaciens TaxID=126385 RepID=UPI00259D68BA